MKLLSEKLSPNGEFGSGINRIAEKNAAITAKIECCRHDFKRDLSNLIENVLSYDLLINTLVFSYRMDDE